MAAITQSSGVVVILEYVQEFASSLSTVGVWMKLNRNIGLVRITLAIFLSWALLPTIGLCANTIEGGGIYYDLNNGLESTYGEYLRARIEQSSADAWSVDITNLDRFGDDGTQLSLGNTHQFDDRWYTQLFVASSVGGFFWPKVRVDGSINRKWFADKRLVTTLGAGYFDAKDEHEDMSAYFAANYYFPNRFVAHGGVSINVSDPGGIKSSAGYVGISYVENKRRIMSVKGSFGNQAYQAITANNFVVDFPYHSVRLTWREWVGATWGVNVAAEHYASEVYNQDGFELGFFKEF